MYCMCVREDTTACVCVCVCVCVCMKRLLALLIVHRWVFTIGKGELERKWWTPCVGDENVPEGTLASAPFTGVCVVVLEIEGKRKLRLFVPHRLWVLSDCAYMRMSVSYTVCVCVCLHQAVRTVWSVVCQWPERGQLCQAPGERPRPAEQG